MWKFVFAIAVAVFLMGVGKAMAEGPFSKGLFISRDTFRLIQQLAKEKRVIEDIQEQNQNFVDPGRDEEIQNQWVRSTDLSDLVQVYRQKPSCQDMRDAFTKEISLVDCYTLDARGRVVGALYQPHDFLQSGNPRFMNCFNHGEGQVYVHEPLPMASVSTLEISLPVTNGIQTIGVLVATILPEK